MNQIYPYEQQMKETLRDLPGGDVERDWDSMRKMLEDEGNNRRIGFIPNWQKAGLLCLFAGVLGLAIGWLQMTSRHQGADPSEPESPASLVKTNPPSTLPHKIQPIVGESTANPITNELADASTKPADRTTPASLKPAQEPSVKIEPTNKVTKSILQNENSSGIPDRYTRNHQQTVYKNSKRQGNNVISGAYQDKISTTGIRYEADASKKEVIAQKNWVEASRADIESLKPAIPDFNNSSDPFRAHNLTFNQPKKISGTGNQFLPGYKIPVVVAGKKERRELKKSFRSINTNSVGNNVAFAAGLLIPTNISVAQQQRPGLNINAANNLITDYIPAAFLQYHITPKLFLHSEFQFQSPQLTNRLLMAQSDLSMGPNSSIQNRVFVEKLYYFNLPISLHYSPLRNFYVGTGMQYSSLISGVAGYETQRIENGVSTNANYQARRFQDDSLSSALRSSDFRWQLDANYYLNRFTFGARYNRALNNLVDIQVGNTRTQARNQNMQVYIRYNLWEEKRSH